MLKSEIRKYYLDKRKELTTEKVEELSINISTQLFQNYDFSKIEVLHTFISIEKFKEVNTWLIISTIWKDYPHIKTVTSITLKDELEHCIFDKSTSFVEDKWGIPTPQNCKKIEANKIDLVITPLLAFDKKNNRVGYGKGYYDKFFADCKPSVQKIGVSLFTVLENEIEDVNEFDIALDTVLYP